MKSELPLLRFQYRTGGGLPFLAQPGMPGTSLGRRVESLQISRREKPAVVILRHSILKHSRDDETLSTIHAQRRQDEISIMRPDQPKPLASAEYSALAEFRYQIRRYLRYMEEEARANGLHPQQYQLLLAIKGLPKGKSPTVSALAERMQMNHNSMVGLVNRCEKRGLIQRTRSGDDRRQVTLAITRQGDLVLRQQANASRNELGSITPILFDSLERLMKSRSRKPAGRRAEKNEET